MSPRVKKVAKRIGQGVGVLVVGAAAWLAYVAVVGIPRYTPVDPGLHVEVTPARVARGKKLATLICTSCHQSASTGALTGQAMKDLPAMFGTVYSANITAHPTRGIGGWTDGQLAYFLRTGVRRDGQYVPPWMIKLPNLSDEDLASIIAFLRSDDPLVAPRDTAPVGQTRPSFLTKVLSHTVMEPLPWPTARIETPPAGDRVATGKYLTYALDCWTCHSPDFKTMNPLHPDQTPGYLTGGNHVVGADGREVATPNLTPEPETGIGRWTEDEFVRALRQGFRPDGRVLRYPMLPKPELGDDEARAIFAYLKTVPAVRHPVERRFDEPAAGDAPGRRLYVQYGCVGCHGDSGVGMGGEADLRSADARYPTDAALRAWIEDAPAQKPGTKMPAWRGLIRDEDWAPLLAHVRGLGRAAQGRQARLP